MIAEIEAAKADGDTLGGVVEVVVHGLPVGLGSFTSGDNRLDSQLAGAVMGIQAIKGVEIGDGFETARRRGSVAHDEMYPGPDGVMRSTNRAGGLEGGMTNGQPLRVRAAMKPISTVPRALATVDMATGDEAVAIHQRSDVCAVPAAGVVVETMVALVLARAALEKFGGDSLAETRANIDTYLRAVADARAAAQRSAGVGLMAPKAVLIGHARLGQVHDRAPAGQGARRAAARHRRRDRARPPAAPSPTSSPTTASRSSAASRRSRPRRAGRSHDGVLSLGGGAITTPGVREALAGHTVIYPRDQRRRRRAPHQRQHRAAAAGRRRPRREVPDADGAAGAAVPAGRHDAGQHQPPQSRRGGALHRVAAGESRRADDPQPTPPPSVVAPRTRVADADAQHRGPTHAGRPLAARRAEARHD